MNSLLTSNVALLAMAVGAMSTAIEMVKSNNFIGAGIMVAISVLLFIGYEKIPPTTPQ